MSVSVLTFAAGDIDYISKMNTNDFNLAAAINALEGAASGGGTFSGTAFFKSLFANASGLIGKGSYLPTPASALLTIAAGGCFKISNSSVVQSIAAVGLDFTELAAGTYYISANAIGFPQKSTSASDDDLYSVGWSGSAFGAITCLVKAMFTAVEEDDARVSTAHSSTYGSLDARLEAVETEADGSAAAVIALDTRLDTAESDIDTAQAAIITLDTRVDAAEADIVALQARTRKVGTTMDNGSSVLATGVKGSIQIDFACTIIGWSIIADVAGSLTIEIDKVASSAPPSAPGIPNTTTDKISASAPISLSSAQSAAVAAAGVSTWTTAIAAWDVIQFNLTAATTIKRAVLYILLRED